MPTPRAPKSSKPTAGTTGKPRAVQEKAAASGGGRFNTDAGTKAIVWARAAGHCELCGTDLTRDIRVGRSVRWGHVAHILPASPQGPRGGGAHTAEQAKAHTDDPDNLMLACPGCHVKADTDADGYPQSDLTDLHAAQIGRIALAAQTPQASKAITLIVLSQHFKTLNLIAKGDLERAMSAEGLTAIAMPDPLVLPEPFDGKRDAAYWRQVTDRIQYEVRRLLDNGRKFHGDVPYVAVVGLADIPALMVLGQALGDRMPRRLFSHHRITGLRWPDLTAPPPRFEFTAPPAGNGPIALALSISGEIPERDILAARPDARIAVLKASEPSTLMVRNREAIAAFVEALQGPLSQLEAASAEPIHIFPALPAAFAIEFGAFLTMQHRHCYVVYDRGANNAFVATLSLGHSEKPANVL